MGKTPAIVLSIGATLLIGTAMLAAPGQRRPVCEKMVEYQHGAPRR